MRAGCLAVVFACVDCAAIHSVESTTNAPLQPSVEHRVVEDSMEFSITTKVEGHQISVAIEQQETCATLTTPRTHRRRYVDRRVDPTLSRTTWAVAGLSLGAGTYGYLNADNLAAQSTAPDSPTAGQYQQYGSGLLVVGLVAATIGIIDGIRASDSSYDDGIIRSRTEREEIACHRRTSSNRAIELRLANGHKLTGKSDDGGSVTFDLSTIPDEGLPGDATGEYVAIGSARVNVELSRVERVAIRSSLLAEPTSRLAMDLLQKRRDACAGVVASARGAVGSSADVSRDVLTGWHSAKTSCGDVWTSGYEAELENVATRVNETECRNGFRVVDEAFGNGADVPVEEMSSALEMLRTRCTTPEHIAKLGRLDAKLATVVKRLEREAAAEARRIAREEAVELQRALARARSQRSVPSPTWPSESRSCCKVCSRGKACGNTCIARSKTCHVGGGCACDG